jgi:small-conductance mechanosensitive channel
MKIHPCLVIVGLLSTFGSAAVAEGQIPLANPPSQTGSDGKNTHASDETSLNELRAKRDKVEAELKAVNRPETLAAGAPRDTPREELLERRTLLHQIQRRVDEQIDDTLRLEQTRQHRTEVAKSLAGPKDRAESPPYSIFYADQLWDTAFASRLAVEGLQSQLSLLELRATRARESLLAAEERLRQASEALESASSPAGADRQRWLRDLEALRHRAAAALLQATETAKIRISEELSDARARLETAEQRLASVEPQVEFAEGDLDTVRARLSRERQALADELEETTAARHRQFDELRSVDQQLAARLAKRPGDNVHLMQVTAEVGHVRSDNLALKGDLLQLLLDVVEGERQLWESRYRLMHSPEPGQAREAYNRFTPLFTNFHASRDYVRQQVSIVSGQISELETRLKNARTVQDRNQTRALLNAHRQRKDIYDHALQRLDQSSRFLARWKSAFKEQQKELPVSARVEEWWWHAWERAKAAWQWEVFSAEDTIEVEGKKITGHRSVTIGKIVNALVMLMIGYWLCLYLAGLIARLAVTRLGVVPELANLLRQWSQALLLTLLIVTSLVWAKIPLTIFAFLGGAFAIGVGFGAQNLLKNVISGILLLIERPLRVGDLIEVENVRGRVTTIGLRSSTVRDSKGVVTLIPNSSFLERHLTNWTYSSRIGRFSLRVGAPYGSSTQLVMDLLAGLAANHRQVLKTPQPQVLLDEFGNQARIFTLNYWLEIRLDIDPHEVASDLRFAIEQKFAEAGMKILPAA